jgi:hypothetical protein
LSQDQKNKFYFDGTRDQKFSVKWLQTPQPVEIKVMMTRCMKDKIPEGQYVIRAGVLDRLIENKLYYKFIEHGIKEQELKEVEKENARQMKDKQA